MMRMLTKTPALTAGKAAGEDAGENVWEVRPGGMLVQKRDPNDDPTRIPPPTIRVRVKFGSIYHEIIINSTATFGELKKMLSGPTGLHHEDQKIMFKDKERASKTYLDVVGVKDRSKMVLLEDPIGRERRQIEARKIAKMEKAVKLISDISLEVDRLATQVSALESVISRGGKVADKTVSDLIGLLMNQLLKLDEIKVDGDVNQKKKIQVEKVKRCVETLDVLKVKNARGSKGNGNGNHAPRPPRPPSERGGRGSGVVKTDPSKRSSGKEVEGSGKKTSGGVVVTTQWETFDSLPTVFATPQTSTSTSTTSETIQHNFNWDLLLK